MNKYNHSTINEARSINKISKEFTETVVKMKEIVKVYTSAEDGSDDKAASRQQLIDLTIKKKALVKELDDAVAGKNKDAKLVISESTEEFELHENVSRDVHRSVNSFIEKMAKKYDIPLQSVVYNIITVLRSQNYDGIPESFQLLEGTMSKIDMIAKEARNLSDFIKRFFKEFEGKIEKTKETIKWAESMYDDMVSEEAIQEKRVITKRKYGDNHPAQTVGMTAKIRNKMLEAIRDGKVAAGEFDRILKELSSNSKRWMASNKRFFLVSEEGITLSKLGKRILKGITVNENMISTEFDSFINEANTLKFKGKKVDVGSIEIGDVDMRDYPDFSDAYIEYAEYTNGKALSEEECSELQDEYQDFVHELAHDSIH